MSLPSPSPSPSAPRFPVGVPAARPDPRSPACHVLWSVELGPPVRTPVTVVGLLDRPMPPDAALAALARAVHRFPPLAAHRTALSCGAGRVVRGERAGEDLADHVRSAVLPAPADDGALLAFAAPLAITPFDRSCVRWDLTLVSGMGGGRGGFVLRLHHALDGGLDARALADVLFEPERPAARPPALDDDVAAGDAAAGDAPAGRTVGTPTGHLAGVFAVPPAPAPVPVAGFDDGRDALGGLAAGAFAVAAP